MEIWHGHFPDGEFFNKLRFLKLRHLSQESSISTCRFVESLTSLDELIVCESYLEDLNNNEEAIEGTSHELKVILPFPRYIRHLQTLDVSHCDGLSKLFTPTIAENLVALTKLRISNCRILTEVINNEKGGEGHVVAFNQLKYMELDRLIGLRSFNSGGYTLIFPLLEDIIVTRCPNMKFFSQGPIEVSKLKKVQVSKEVWFWAGNLNITIQNMFEEMGTFVGVKKMLLSEFPGLIGKWHNKLHPIKSHWQLESLVVDKCPFINAIPSGLILVLDNLSFLQVRDCKLLEEIFDLEGLEVVESTQVLPQLCELNLANLPKLRRLWNKDLQESIHFDSLRFLILYNCSNLGHAFASSMAQCLANLEKMEIKECGQMEGVIIEEEGQGSAMEKITFPKLRQMKLECLPNLTCLLLGKNHTLECPKLTVLSITHCPKMRSLTRQSWMENVHNNPSLFTPQDFPNFKRLLLVNNNIQMIQDGNFPDDIFSKPKALTLACFHDENAIFPSIFLLERFHNLQSLEVFCSSFEDIFLDEGLVEEGKHPVLENLREIKLNKLHYLKRVWREDSLVSKIIQSIETFEIWDCPCLMTIFPTVASFQNLTKLVVKNSSGLVHLVTVSTVTNLMHLNNMTIIGCEKMKEIVANDEIGEGKVIFFGNLHYLTLQDLPSLECFSSISSCTFRFPCLWTIKVEECPKMKSFSKGTLSTPQLCWPLGSVSLFRYKWKRNWGEGDDLNTTIQKLSA
ncbi:uncharacterized protein LOC120296284 isoform X2 [Eucalyptus grandis]|uniref:uncharacterized protein LOC120296284 isoform X2 n=1 Tax=Eucalyptus grandis TaxID=71139 RepID=UPI00192EF089|nr:uncharacterized protein LOC120296284 isoform X2 [Eucalyptus grandis]